MTVLICQVILLKNFVYPLLDPIYSENETIHHTLAEWLHMHDFSSLNNP